jgi:hypothetical protein
MTILAEPGTVSRDEMQRSVLLASARKGPKEYRLEWLSKGWTIAGSMMRLQERATYRVSFLDHNGTRHGRCFKTASEAREMFNAWTEVTA